MNERTLIERLNIPWPEQEAEEVTLPAWVMELCAEGAARIAALEAQLAARTGAVKVKWLIAELEQMTEIDRTHLREVASDEIKAILSAFEATPEPKVTEAMVEAAAASLRPDLFTPLDPADLQSDDYALTCRRNAKIDVMSKARAALKAALTAAQEAGKP